MRRQQLALLSCVLMGLASCQQNTSNQSPPRVEGEPRRSVADLDAPKSDDAGSRAESSRANGSALTVFEQRIIPIFQAAKPSSCTECHLSGVELSNYIHPSQERTFGALVSAGLIDVKNPRGSKILEFISRRPHKPNLITEKVRQEEYGAFEAWIRAAVKDPNLLAVKSSSRVGPEISDELIRHARKDRVLASFVENVWTEVGRCAACHSPDRNQKQVKEHGEHVSWITLKDPSATLNHMLDAEIINAEDPLESMLLTKPTMQVEHGGGQKVVVGDRTYKQFRRFIDDYARIASGAYTTTESLPQESDEVSLVTEIWLKLTDVPPKYDQMLLQADLYRWTGEGWSEHRLASSDRLVFGKGKLWQHSLSLTAPRGSAWAREMQSKRLPGGRYLARLYIDQAGKLGKDFRAELGPDEFIGQVELRSQWPAGYGRMTVVRFPSGTHAGTE